MAQSKIQNPKSKICRVAGLILAGGKSSRMGLANPLAAVYRTTVLPHVQELLAADQLRPAFLFDRVQTVRVPVEELRSADPQLATLRNLNRPEDYLSALREAGFEPEASVLSA